MTTQASPESSTEEMDGTQIVINDTESDDEQGDSGAPNPPSPEYAPEGKMLREGCQPDKWIRSRPLDRALEMLGRAFRPSTCTFDSGMLEGTPKKNPWLSQHLTKSNQQGCRRMVAPMEKKNTG